jgi:hypothetical protein
MFETLGQKFGEWLEDTAHWLKTGESTIRCYNDGDHHKVYINEWGGTRVDSLEILELKDVVKTLSRCQDLQ